MIHWTMNMAFLFVTFDVFTDGRTDPCIQKYARTHALTHASKNRICASFIYGSSFALTLGFLLFFRLLLFLFKKKKKEICHSKLRCHHAWHFSTKQKHKNCLRRILHMSACGIRVRSNFHGVKKIYFLKGSTNLNGISSQVTFKLSMVACGWTGARW